jgi:hypothetical protein
VDGREAAGVIEIRALLAETPGGAPVGKVGADAGDEF